MIVAILVCCVLAVLILLFWNSFETEEPIRYDDGVWMWHDFPCKFSDKCIRKFRAFPPTATFFPFLSAGGSYIVVSYGLIGIVLSIYRYKNVYPRHVKVKMPHIKMTIDL